MPRRQVPRRGSTRASATGAGSPPPWPSRAATESRRCGAWRSARTVGPTSWRTRYSSPSKPRASPPPALGRGARGRAEPGRSPNEVEGLAVDSQGRVLVTGSVYRGHQPGHAYNTVYAAYVVRYLPDGNRDVTFGSGGEVQTTF